jgi:oxygen-independent coproporphyrinogen-3 oxidase
MTRRLPLQPASRWGVYIHVPWCRVRCPYCAFYVERDHAEVPWTAFVDRLLGEYNARRADFPGEPHTVYLGGGTPSRMPTRELARLLSGIGLTAAVEVTLEANPEDVHETWLDAIADAGVDRLSLGIQSLDATAARHLGRAHSAHEGRAAATLVQASRLRTWSADLMFGLHDQTTTALGAELAQLIALGPPHVSVYGLTIEPGTAYERGAASGAIRPAGDDTWRAMYAHIVRRLEHAGLHRYEVSNFSKPGHEAEHNRGYWEDRPYMGLGPSAHGYAPDGTRWSNIADVDRYLQADDPAEFSERPSPEQRAIDLLVSGMRGVHGISLERFRALTHLTPSTEILERLQAFGMIRQADGRMMLDTEGFFLADTVVRTLVDHLVPSRPSAGSETSEALDRPTS